MTLKSDNSKSLDMAQKRGSFIGKIKILEQKCCVSWCDIKMIIFGIYTMNYED